MRFLSLLGVFLAVQCMAQANQTAYTALRVFGKKEGEPSLHRIVELRGRAGTPQPVLWKLIIDDPRARGGVREVEIRETRIVGERTPVGRELGAPMNFSQLNLDSEGAFTVADQEAGKQGVAFERVDYLLHGGAGGTAPVWELTLLDGANGRVGFLRVAADSGEIIERNFSRSRPPAEADDQNYVDDRRPLPPPSDRSVTAGDVGQSVGNFINRVGRHFQKRGRQLENFFTGKHRDEER